MRTNYQDSYYDTRCDTVDVHYCSVDIAIRTIQKEIIKMIQKGVYYFEVIHGYNKGSHIKQAILNQRIKSKNIARISMVPHNDGRIGIYLKGGMVK